MAFLARTVTILYKLCMHQFHPLISHWLKHQIACGTIYACPRSLREGGNGKGGRFPGAPQGSGFGFGSARACGVGEELAGDDLHHHAY